MPTPLYASYSPLKLALIILPPTLTIVYLFPTSRLAILFLPALISALGLAIDIFFQRKFSPAPFTSPDATHLLHYPAMTVLPSLLTFLLCR